MTKKQSTAAPTISNVVASVLDFRYFHEEDGHPPAIPLHYVPGKVPLAVVVGPNAGGKSFFRRLVGHVYAQSKPAVEFIGISMEFRTGTGVHAGNIMRAFVFGDEGSHATGAISATTVTTGIKTCRSREKPHVIFWDEPDIGLSEGYSRGVGHAIRGFVEDLPQHTAGVFVVSHSKPLVRELALLEPHYVHLGSTEAPATLQEWLDTEAPAQDIDTLSDRALERFRAIQRILKSVQKPG